MLFGCEMLPHASLFYLVGEFEVPNLAMFIAERGIGSTQLLLWVALISFEYNWRYRGDSPLQLLRSSTLGATLNFLTGCFFSGS